MHYPYPGKGWQGGGKNLYTQDQRMIFKMYNQYLSTIVLDYPVIHLKDTSK